MRRIICIVAAFAVLITLSACVEQGGQSPIPLPSEVVTSAPPTDEVTVVPTEEPTLVLDITERGTGATGVQISYPYHESDTEQAQLVNEFFDNLKQRYWDSLDEVDITFHSLGVNYGVEYNANGIVSYLFEAITTYSDNYLGTNTDYAYTVLGEEMDYTAYTVDYLNGTRVTLDEVFTVPQSEYLQRLIRYVIGSGEAEYVDGYLDNAEKMFDAERFYLAADAVVIFYPPNTALKDNDEWFFQSVPFAELSDILAEWVYYDQE